MRNNTFIVFFIFIFLYACTDNSQDDSANLPKFRPLSDVVQIDSGELFTLALKSDGTVWGWGANGFGQLGHDSSEFNVAPLAIQIPRLKDITFISAGYNHGLAINNKGQVYSWGANYYAQLGDSTDPSDPNHFDSPRPSPDFINFPEAIIYVSAGTDHNLAISETGVAYSWGRNLWDLGYTSETVLVTRPQAIPNIANTTLVNAGTWLSAIMTDMGELYTWGHIAYSGYQLGLSTHNTGLPRLVDGLTTPLNSLRGLQYLYGTDINGNPVEIYNGLTTITAFNNIKNAETCCFGLKVYLTNNGELLAYGNNANNLLNTDNSTIESVNYITFDLPAISNFQLGASTVRSQYEFIVALDTDGHVWTWGGNAVGQLGNGTLDANNKPALVQF